MVKPDFIENSPFYLTEAVPVSLIASPHFKDKYFFLRPSSYGDEYLTVVFYGVKETKYIVKVTPQANGSAEFILSASVPPTVLGIYDSLIPVIKQLSQITKRDFILAKFTDHETDTFLCHTSALQADLLAVTTKQLNAIADVTFVGISATMPYMPFYFSQTDVSHIWETIAAPIKKEILILYKSQEDNHCINVACRAEDGEYQLFIYEIYYDQVILKRLLDRVNNIFQLITILKMAEPYELLQHAAKQFQKELVILNSIDTHGKYHVYEVQGNILQKHNYFYSSCLPTALTNSYYGDALIHSDRNLDFFLRRPFLTNLDAELILLQQSSTFGNVIESVKLKKSSITPYRRYLWDRDSQQFSCIEEPDLPPQNTLFEVLKVDDTYDRRYQALLRKESYGTLNINDIGDYQESESFSKAWGNSAQIFFKSRQAAAVTHIYGPYNTYFLVLKIIKLPDHVFLPEKFPLLTVLPADIYAVIAKVVDGNLLQSTFDVNSVLFQELSNRINRYKDLAPLVLTTEPLQAQQIYNALSDKEDDFSGIMVLKCCVSHTICNDYGISQESQVNWPKGLNFDTSCILSAEIYMQDLAVLPQGAVDALAFQDNILEIQNPQAPQFMLSAGPRP